MRHRDGIYRMVGLAPLLAAGLTLGGEISEEAAALQPRVDAIFADLDRSSSPGCVVGVVHKGAMLYSKSYGAANLEHQVPLKPTSVLDLASESKQFTAAAVLLAAEEGHLALDDEVRKHVPELPDYGRKLTLRHLLHHTGGVRDYGTLRIMAGKWPGDMNDATLTLELLARQRRLNFAPGDEYSYSNSGYFLLGLVVERATGRSLREYARQKIFEPLGMTNTLFADDRQEIVPHRATGHARGESGFVRQVDNNEVVGPSRVLTTLEDLVRWDSNFHDNQLGKGGG